MALTGISLLSCETTIAGITMALAITVLPKRMYVVTNKTIAILHNEMALV